MPFAVRSTTTPELDRGCGFLIPLTELRTTCAEFPSGPLSLPSSSTEFRRSAWSVPPRWVGVGGLPPEWERLLAMSMAPSVRYAYLE